MTLPYRYRGVVLLSLIVLVLPWAAWRFALRDTFGAWRDCRRLSAQLAATPAAESRGPAAAGVQGAEPDSFGRVARYRPAGRGACRGAGRGLRAARDTPAGRVGGAYRAANPHRRLYGAPACGRRTGTRASPVPSAFDGVAHGDRPPHAPPAIDPDALYPANRIERITP